MADHRSIQIHLPSKCGGEDGNASGGGLLPSATSMTPGTVVYQATNLSRSINPPQVLESLNNGTVLGGSQNNLCNGAINTGSVLARKVPNNSPNNHKRPMMSLTHLPKRPPVDIQFTDMSYSVSEGRKRGYKTILKCVNGKFRSGELTAIMGPSGAGKSTLMNILAGYKTSHLSGSVLINGKERNLRRFRKLSCYIMQDDCLLPHLTVKEAMVVSANLKLGKDTSKAAKKIVVNEIIEMLGLSDASDTQAGNLSGGQRKRLSIALEMVNNPPVMFFDEPTSGLDSSSCFQCISLLKSLARGGRTIICTIHQPSARLFEMFDHLYTLAEGQCIYQGSVSGLVPFLSSMGLECPSYHNPADYVMEVACGEHGECVHKLVCAVNNGKCNNWNRFQVSPRLAACASSIANDIAKESNSPLGDSTALTMSTAASASCAATSTTSTTNPTSTSTGKSGHTVVPVVTCTTSLLDSNESMTIQPEKTGFPTSTWQQFWILLKRTFRSIIRDKTLTLLRMVSHLVVGFLIGMIYYDIGNEASKVTSNAGCIFFTVMFTMFTAMMPTILTFPTEMAVFVREYLNYWYSMKAFYLAKTVADIPFQAFFSILYVAIVYFLTSQPFETNRFLMVSLMCVLSSLVSQSIGLLIGAGMNIENGVFLGPVTTIPVILFSGFFVNFNAIPDYLYWLPYASYARYSFEGTMISIYGYNREKLHCSEAYCHFRSPTKFLEEMTMKDAVYWIDVVALTGFFVFIRFIAYFVLKLKLLSLR